MKRLTKSQRALLMDFVGEVNRGEADHPASDYPAWALDWPLWSAGENMPGYMPDSPYVLFLTEREARGYCRSLEREAGHRDGGYVTDLIPTSLREVLP